MAIIFEAIFKVPLDHLIWPRWIVGSVASDGVCRIDLREWSVCEGHDLRTNITIQSIIDSCSGAFVFACWRSESRKLRRTLIRCWTFGDRGWEDIRLWIVEPGDVTTLLCRYNMGLYVLTISHRHGLSSQTVGLCQMHFHQIRHAQPTDQKARLL